MDILVVTPATANEQSLTPGINHYTQLATLISTFKQKDNLTYARINYITNIDGRALNYPVFAIVKEDSIRYPVPPTTVVNEVFYSRRKNSQLAATGFVDLTDHNGLINSSRIPLGTGIYGKFFQSQEDAIQGMLPDESVYQIDSTGSYQLVDAAHGDLLTLASIWTNRYLTHSLLLNQTEVSDSVLGHLTNLWRMVFLRTQEGSKVTPEILSDIFTNYLTNYDNNAYISPDLIPLQILPINHIMERLGYSGIFAKDNYNNSRDRGCVSYKIDEASIYLVGHAQY